MAEESDGIEEVLEGQIRVLVTAGGQLGERIARSRQEALRQAQTDSGQEVRELRSRLEAEQSAARTEYAGVYRSAWWDRATPEQIGHTWQVAQAWGEQDPEAGRAVQRIRDELRTRYGIDADHTNADPAAVEAAFAHADAQGAQAETQRIRAEEDNAEAQQLLREADREDRAAETAQKAAEFEPDPADRAEARTEVAEREAVAMATREDWMNRYDSAERRDADAARLESLGIDETVVATRMRADVSQAKPASEAVKTQKTIRKAPQARRTASRAAQVQRSELSR